MKKLGIILVSFLIYGFLQAELKLKVYLDHYKPYHYELNGEIQGELIVRLHEVFRKNKIKYSIHIAPWNRVMYKSKFKNTLIGPIARTQDRENKFFWIHKYHLLKTNFYSCSENVEMNNLNDLKKYSVGAIINDFRVKYLIKNKILVEEQLEYVEKAELNLTKCLLGRIDVFFLGEFFFNKSVHELTLDRSRFYEIYHDPIFDKQLYLALSKNSDPALKDLLLKVF